MPRRLGAQVLSDQLFHILSIGGRRSDTDLSRNLGVRLLIRRRESLHRFHEFAGAVGLGHNVAERGKRRYQKDGDF